MSLDLAGSLIWWVGIIAICALRISGYLSPKEWWLLKAFDDGTQIFFEAAERDFVGTTLFCILTAFDWFMYRVTNDDDEPKKKRKMGYAKIPRPRLVQIRPAGAT